MSKLQTKLTNFRNALRRLSEAVIELEKSGSSDVVRDGVIQRFEFTYELAWKTIKEYIEYSGIVDKNSPRAVIKEAYTQRLILNEQTWLLMLDDRNKTVHVYDEKLAQDIAGRIVGNYIREFELLLQELEKQ